MEKPIIGLVILAAIFLVIALIRKNKDDRKNYEKELNKSEFLEEEKHNNNEPTM